ncbi:MAG TPA: hypothetical protein VMF61_15620 [Candidatus Acidoferrales bacterium]|nr:hypothetical protein [Candidatus Acidoferrales bacterium]
MRPSLLIAAAAALSPVTVLAQSPVPSPAAMAFEGITLGEPIAGLKPRLGDPLAVLTTPSAIIWRYLQHGGAVYVDVIVKNNVASSVTVLPRLPGVPYTDTRGASFGMSADQVREKLGVPSRVSTNADDGSVDLWYRSGEYAWIYELHADKLDFIQLIVSPPVAAAFASGPATAPSDGTTLDRAIWIRPSNILVNTVWIGAYLALNACGTNGHWRETGSQLKDDPATHQIAYTIVQARCTDGTAERDFYFDVHGTTNPSNSTNQIYVNPGQRPGSAASAPPAPAGSPPLIEQRRTTRRVLQRENPISTA